TPSASVGHHQKRMPGLVRTVTGMTAEEAKFFGISEEERQSLIRVDDAKINLARKSGKATWFKLVGIRLDNRTDDYPNGDEVQTVERWEPPDTFAHLTPVTINAILDRLEAGPYEGGRYSSSPIAKTRAAWPVVQEFCPSLTDEQCKGVIAKW